MTARPGRGIMGGVGITFADLLDEQDWVPLSLDQQSFPSYLWVDGGTLADAPVDFAATFDGAMWMSRKPIEIPVFNRNPLRVRPHFVVPRHHHNFDEMLFVFQGRVQHRVRHGRRRHRNGRGEAGRRVRQSRRHAVHDDGRARGCGLHRDVARADPAAHDDLARLGLGPSLNLGPTGINLYASSGDEAMESAPGTIDMGRLG